MIKKLVFILCLLFGMFSISLAQNYNFQYLTIQKGLPQSQVLPFVLILMIMRGLEHKAEVLPFTMEKIINI